MDAHFQAVLASTLSSLLGLTGGFLLLWRQAWVKQVAKYFVSFAAGALLGAAFFDLLVEGIAEYPTQVTAIFGWVTVGFLIFFLIEKLLLWHHHSHAHGDEEEREGVLNSLIITGDAIHNFIDGTIIGATYLISPSLGFVTALAVFFHEIPQELGDFSIMIRSGMSRRRVIAWNIFGALVSPLGAIATIFLAGRISSIVMPLIGIAAGSFIYIAAADLVPEIHREKKPLQMLGQVLLLLVGIGAIIGIGHLFPGG